MLMNTETHYGTVEASYLEMMYVKFDERIPAYWVHHQLPGRTADAIFMGSELSFVPMSELGRGDRVLIQYGDGETIIPGHGLTNPKMPYIVAKQEANNND